MRGSRHKNDSNDINMPANVLESISPFSSDCTLRDIVIGVTAKEEVDVNELQVVG